jgi:DMSO/TMAO reductase YedYZ heme-binding membrane subunit
MIEYLIFIYLLITSTIFLIRGFSKALLWPYFVLLVVIFPLLIIIHKHNNCTNSTINNESSSNNT